MALNQRQIPRPSDFLGQGRPNMDIKHPQVLTTGRKTDYALDPSASMGSRKAGNPPPHTLTGWARGCGDSGPALPSRPGPPPPHRAPPARCPSLHRWPWRLREDLLEGVTTKCGTVTGGTRLAASPGHRGEQGWLTALSEQGDGMRSPFHEMTIMTSLPGRLLIPCPHAAPWLVPSECRSPSCP